MEPKPSCVLMLGPLTRHTSFAMNPSLQNLSSDGGVYEGLPTHYGLNLVNQKITFPLDDNYSDDELAFLPYFTYFFTAKVSPTRLFDFKHFLF